MPIDTSIYQTLRPIQMPDVMDSMSKAMALKHLGIQNDQIQQTIDTNQTIKALYAKNTGADGKLDQTGFLADLGKVSPQMSLQYQEQFNKGSKEQAENQKLQDESVQKRMGLLGSAFNYLHALPDDQKPVAYDSVRKQMLQMGAIKPTDAPEQFSLDWYKQVAPSFVNSPEALKAEETKASTNEKNSQAKKFSKDASGPKPLTEWQTEHLVSSLKDDLDPNKARGGNLAKSQAMINSADRVDALFQQYPDGNIPKAQSSELANAVAAIVGGGSAQSQHQINSIVPSSMVGDANAITSWITNEPRGQGQQQFMKALQESARRERDVADNQVRTAQVQRLSAHGKLMKSDPDTYWSVVKAYGLDPEDIQNGRYVPKSKQQAPTSAGSTAPGSVVEIRGKQYKVGADGDSLEPM